MLEVWLQHAIRTSEIRQQVLDFLEIPEQIQFRLIQSTPCALKDGDLLIAELIMGLKYEPSHRFKTLEHFEKNMFKVN